MRKVCTILESVNQPVRCIQREQPKATLVLSTNNSVMEIFEKTLIGGFSCVNTRLSFDRELLMPNLTEADYKKRK